MQITFTFADGRTVAAKVLPIDRIMFERKFSTSVIQAATVDQREEYFLWLGWHALNRQGQASDDFDAWLATVADYETGVEAEVPSDPVANTGS
jgi:hypothetical protein